MHSRLSGALRLAWSLSLALAGGICAATSGRAATTVNPVDLYLSQARALRLAGDSSRARVGLGAMPGVTNRSAIAAILAELEVAHTWLDETNFAAARDGFHAVASNESAPKHLQEEARNALRHIERRTKAHGQQQDLISRFIPMREFHVAPDGSDARSGTAQAPFATVQRARDAIRELNKLHWPAGGVAVVIHDGAYAVRRTLQLGREDSGLPEGPVVYRAAQGAKPVFTGGVRLTNFIQVANAEVLARLPGEARGKVMQANLREAGITDIPPLKLGGFGSGRGFKTHPTVELFFDGTPQQLARWPNDDFVVVDEVSTNALVVSHGLRGSKEGRFMFGSDRPRRWKDEKEIWLYGYWFWDWADSYERVASMDVDTREIRLAAPVHNYGFRKGQRFHALNLLSEIDQPGEWFLDRDAGMLYFWPPAAPEKANIEISLAPFTFVELKDVSDVRFEGLTWDLGTADAVHVNGGTNVVFAGCTIQRFAGTGMEIHGGEGHQVISCDIRSLGRGGISMSGGDRKTLRRSRHLIENCHIHDLSRIDHTYTPAIVVSGVGHRIAHNLMHDIRSSAMRVGGNEHVIEFNEMAHVVQESDDQGAVDMYGDPTFRGVVFRWNYFHHIGPWKKARTEPPLGQAGIRLDDAICGVLIYGNVFRHAATGKIGFGGVQIHGGKDNIIDNNLFVDCATAVSFTAWPESHWRDFTKNALAAKEIDVALFMSRYPDFARLNEGLNINQLWRNQVVGCGRFLHRNRAAKLIGNIQVTNGVPELERELTCASDGSAGLPGELRVARIPFHEIGLQRDSHREQAPAALITKLRGDD